MRRQIAHIAIRHAFRAPVTGQIWVRQEILRMFATKRNDLTQGSIGNQLTGKLRGRRPDVIKPDHIDRRSYLSSIDHRPTVLQSRPQWLFAENRQTTGKCSFRNLAMGALG